MKYERTLEDGAIITCDIEEGNLRVKIPWTYIPEPVSAVTLLKSHEEDERA